MQSSNVYELHGNKAESNKNIESLLTLSVIVSPTRKTKSGKVSGVNKGTLVDETD